MKLAVVEEIHRMHVEEFRAVLVQIMKFRA